MMANPAQVSLVEEASDTRPAEPLLASQLISEEELDKLLESVCNTSLNDKNNEKEKLGSGLKSLDSVLEGGFKSGRVIGISGEAGAGANEICSTLLVSSLFQYENSTAAVVDTTGNFDILRLYTLIVARLTRQPNTLASLRSCTDLGSEASSIQDVAAKMLDRVKMMRVFDLVGVREAVEEIRNEMEARSGEVRTRDEEENEKRDEQHMEEIPTEKGPKVKRRFVADSEDEDDEILFESDVTTTSTPPAAASRQESSDLATPMYGPEMKPGKGTQGNLKFLLIDNLTQILHPLLKKDAIQGNALAHVFLATLTHLTHSHTLHTVLANPATLLRDPSPTRSLQPLSNRKQAAMRQEQQQQQRYHQQQREAAPHPSMFASNKVVPGLQGLLARHADVQVLVSRLPRRNTDAQVYYAGDDDDEDDGGGGARGVRKRRVDMVGVLEVVGDRWGGRTGAWATFREGKHGISDV